ncbi:Pectinesterase, catalytic [Dillenia turbinata]|uniref:pectinesterase n=1 Tax=Dillenia turbinata TaxID=194707 RepID=A0AAN8W9Z3_9MAGN
MLKILTILLLGFHLVIAKAAAADNNPIPPLPWLLDLWISDHIKEYNDNALLDPVLVKAEQSLRVIKVRKHETGDFNNVTDALKSVPSGNQMRTIIWIGGVYSASMAVESDYFMAVNIASENSSPRPNGKRQGAQAVAMRISGDKAAFYKCTFIGFQDTLRDDNGRYFFMDCFIQGTFDFIFGDGQSLYLVDYRCPICGLLPETMLHLLGDCDTVRSV